jgi:AraC-like DNA-binding protein
MLDDRAGTEFYVPNIAGERQNRPINFVTDETMWRVPPMPGTAPAARIQATRWWGLSRTTREFHAETPAETYLAQIVLKNSKMRLSVDGKAVQDGSVVPGMFHVSAPGTTAAARFLGSYDTLHLYVSKKLMEECGRGLSEKTGSLVFSVGMTKDSVVDSLSRALLDATLSEEPFSLQYIDHISIALVARLLQAAASPARLKSPRVAELARWRLKRAVDFIDASLDQTISLSELAAVSGLSRMHFAAQFRAATGLRPHEYLLRRRIERAQELLLGGSETIVEVALSVGFQTQSHFTSIFKRFVGQTPQVWRRTYAVKSSVTDARKQAYLPLCASSRGGHLLKDLGYPHDDMR